MSTPQEQRTIKVPFGPGRLRAQGTAPAPALEQAPVPVPATASGTQDKPRGAAPMQALAAELQQAALQGVFEYPGNWLLVSRVVAVLLVALSAFHVAMVVIPSAQAAGSIVGGLFTWRVLGSLVGLAVGSGLAALIANLFQTIQVSPQGLTIVEITGKRRIPWKQIGVLRVMEMPTRGQYMVMIPVEGKLPASTPAPMLAILPMLTGASRTRENGLVITSHMKNFERLLQLIVSYMAQEAGQVVPAVEAFVDENTVIPVGQLIFEQSAAVSRLAQPPDTSLDPYGMPADEDAVPLPWQALLTRQAWIALVPAVLILVDIFLRNSEKPLSWVQGWWVVAIFALGVAELPFIAKMVQAVGELVVGGGHLKRTVWAYLELQVPRVVLVAIGAALIGVGVPATIAQLVWLGGIVVTTMLLTSFVMKMYHITLAQAAMAAIGAFLYQVALLAFYFAVR